MPPTILFLCNDKSPVGMQPIKWVLGLGTLSAALKWEGESKPARMVIVPRDPSKEVKVCQKKKPPPKCLIRYDRDPVVGHLKSSQQILFFRPVFFFFFDARVYMYTTFCVFDTRSFFETCSKTLPQHSTMGRTPRSVCVTHVFWQDIVTYP